MANMYGDIVSLPHDEYFLIINFGIISWNFPALFYSGGVSVEYISVNRIVLSKKKTFL